MRLEKFFGCKNINDFFSVNNVTAVHSSTENVLIRNHITKHMEDINKNDVPIFYATKKLRGKGQYRVPKYDRVQHFPEYEIVIHATKPKIHHHIELYYVDWDNDTTRSINLKNNHSGIEPNFFMTAAMNGCSLHFEGNNRKTPLIKHINAVGTKTSPVNRLNMTKDALLESDYGLRKEQMQKESKKMVQKDQYSFTEPKLGHGLQPSDYRDNFGESKSKALKEFKGVIGEQQYYKKKWKTNKRVEFTETRVQCYGIRDPKVGWTFYMSRKLYGIIKYKKHFYSTSWKDFHYCHIMPPVEIWPDTKFGNAYKL
ncbi:MAG: hypothetical protein KAR13_22120 [Desulfobulbaceae bacterium]|nr:hypothetical protein [Desulfobulbaceae bacterium]